MKLVPLPLPLRGLNTVDPNVSIDSGYARELTNMMITAGKLTQRPGIYATYNPAGAGTLAWYDVINNRGIEAAAPGRIVNLSTGASSSDIGGACQAFATTFSHASIEVLCGCGAPRSPDGTAFTSHGFVLSAITDETTITAGCSYRGRPFFTNGSTIEYGDIGQVTGAFASDGLSGGSFSVTDLLEGTGIYRIFALTIQSGNESDVVFVVFGAAGRVLVYSGDWPDASNWQLIGNYLMPPPASRVSFLELDGDIWVATTRYPYKVKDLISSGIVAAYENRISKPIDNLWQSMIWTRNGADNTASPAVSHVFYIENLLTDADPTITRTPVDAIVFQARTDNADLDFIGNYDDGGICLVYFRQYDAWALWLTIPFLHPVRKIDVDSDETYYYGLGPAGTPIIQELYFGDWTDRIVGAPDQDIYCSWKTPYDNSAFKGSQQKVEGVRIFFQHVDLTYSIGAFNFDGYIYKVRSIFDGSDLSNPWGFYSQPSSSLGTMIPGDFNSNEASLTVPENLFGVYTGMANPGGQGASVSFNIVLGKSADEYAAISRVYINSVTALISDGGPL